MPRCDVEAPLSDGLTRPLHIACRRGYEKSATLLLGNGANHTAPGPRGLSALHMAAKEGKAAIVEVKYTYIPLVSVAAHPVRSHAMLLCYRRARS